MPKFACMERRKGRDLLFFGRVKGSTWMSTTQIPRNTGLPNVAQTRRQQPGDQAQCLAMLGRLISFENYRKAAQLRLSEADQRTLLMGSDLQQLVNERVTIVVMQAERVKKSMA